jgi:L-glutamine:2-deoxy-scyllo-inosose/3-amino-2,3-dideoxy-scyllo-inosose aminotransferase
MAPDVLALHGGVPVRSSPWPPWPEADDATERAVQAVLHGGRWAVSAPSTGRPSAERTFAEAFATYHGVPRCVATDHGSSALVLALEALGVGPGDTVIVPVLTWIATATAVLRVGATPVFVDVDARTGCISVAEVQAAIDRRTRAIVVVHLHCVMADMDALPAVAARHGIPLVEDCAQACGSSWRGRKAGTIGVLGAFSMQHGKVLTCGEGGAVLTHDSAVADRLEQLRADSRRYTPETPPAGQMELVIAGNVMGTNRCLSEIHAAVLLDQLRRLDQQLDRREANATLLAEELAHVQGAELLTRPDAMDRQSFYECAIRVDTAAFGGASVGTVAQAVQAELGLAVYPPDAPLNVSPHYRPATNPRYAAVAGPLPARRFDTAAAFRDSTILFHHRALLGGVGEIEAIVNAVDRVQRNADSLVG